MLGEYLYLYIKAWEMKDLELTPHLIITCVAKLFTCKQLLFVNDTSIKLEVWTKEGFPKRNLLRCNLWQ